MRRSLLWFKHDLRLDDHPALIAAASSERMLPVYVLDPKLLQQGQLGARALGVHRARFLLESLLALDGALRARGSHLLVVQGQPEHILPLLAERLDISEVVTHEEIAPQALSEIARLRAKLGQVPLRLVPGHGLLQASELPCPVEQLPAVYRDFCAVMEERLVVFQPLAAPERLPAIPEAAVELLMPPPTLSHLGLGEPIHIADSAFPFSGGEAAAQGRLRDYLWDSQGVRQYASARDSLIGTEYSSKLSPWLANGCLSVRRVVADLRRHEAQYGRNESTQELWRAVLWREFFRWTLVRRGEALFQAGGLKATQQAPTAVDERFLQWTQGRTGMPLVDACMRELAATGFISKRGRQVVASYLVNELRQDWRHGAAWFEEHLLDYEAASNWGNWAYLTGIACDPVRSQTLNPLLQARRFDPEAAYVSLWLSELRALPVAMRHTPFVLSHLQLNALNYPRLEHVPESWQPYLPGAAA
ncbi:DASH family cryptochrome [Pseudomonas turukhanskensis]|uniref:Cryptochrome DASH n=1 Tax=Pseudomonas turukhanskensis TaxID=1806536 RepID=A0A9W6NE62_9PSED|nr:DASH family cryptochrome [Pseudomonas turukhanskensis]GLK87417.1 cryptochrome DASH [Pseudomonas turukhanskensis]